MLPSYLTRNLKSFAIVPVITWHHACNTADGHCMLTKWFLTRILHHWIVPCAAQALSMYVLNGGGGRTIYRMRKWINQSFLAAAQSNERKMFHHFHIDLCNLRDPDAGKGWGHEEKGGRQRMGWMTSPTRWTWVWTSPGRETVKDREACCSPWGRKDGTGLSDWTTTLQVNYLEAVVLEKLSQQKNMFINIQIQIF